MTEALIGFIAIFALALLRVPLAFGMGLVGIVGIGLTRSWGAALASTAQVVQETGFAYTLSVIPLFILMGNFVARAGLAHELFHAAYVFIGHLRGGLAHATIAACAGFGAICGSSIATAATMSKVAYPSMKKLGYSDSLSTGVIAAGGTLGIMIPPSTIMVIYGIVTETNIGKLFAAGVIPGLLTAALLMVAVVIMTSRDPEHAPAGEKFSWAERWKALRGIWGVLLLVIVALFLLLLAENSRVPVDDPATHLELTMIHEVMILDHSGPDLALIEFGAHCRLLFSACLVASLLRPPLAAGPLPSPNTDSILIADSLYISVPASATQLSPGSSSISTNCMSLP